MAQVYVVWNSGMKRWPPRPAVPTGSQVIWDSIATPEATRPTEAWIGDAWQRNAREHVMSIGEILARGGRVDD
jgi:hypothetical protein